MLAWRAESVDLPALKTVSPPLYLAQVTNPSVIQEHRLTETSTRKRYQVLLDVYIDQHVI